MGGRLLDYIAQGAEAARPLAADMPARITAGAASIYYANDTKVFSLFDGDAEAWDETPLATLTGNLLDLLDVDNSTPIADGQHFVWNAASSKFMPEEGGESAASVKSIVGNMLLAEGGIDLDYNIADGTVTIIGLITQYTNAMAVAAVGPIPTTESIQDIVGALLAQGNGVSLNYDDAGNLLTISIARSYRVGWFFTAALAASETILIHTFTQAATFPANFGNARGAVDGVAAAATFAIDVQKNNVSVGTISIATTGVFTFTSTGGLAVAFAIGDRMRLVGPGVAGTPTNVSGTFEGTY